jgi:Tfp pilus assembly protein PilV
MLNILSNNKGISMVESLVAIVLTAIAIVTLMPMQNNAIRTVSRSDYLGRAEGIMQSQLELEESKIINNTGAMASLCTPVTSTPPAITVSGQPGVAGDVTFKVVTTRTIPPTANNNTCLINVTVTWTVNKMGIENVTGTANTTSIKSSVITSCLSCIM